ncbi:MAG: MlaD family protein, partial [Thermodesulfobacteriota bacterium]|nr:MlaD family protein [Thermodesulfobacteriota bacterium]
MSSISTEAKVGLFVLVALVILGYMSFRVGEYGFGLKEGYVVKAVFNNASGLDKDASVVIAGVEVGRVESITLTNGKALVTMRILPDVKLQRDVSVFIKTHGVLGDKYVEIEPGTKGVEYIEDGGVIAHVKKQADIDKLLRELGNISSDVMKVTSSLENVIAGKEGEANLKAILTNTKELTENLNNIVKRNDEKVNIMISNFSNASKEMKRAFTALNEIVEKINSGEGTIGQLVKDEGVFDNLDKTIASLRDIAEKINEGKGSIGRLVNEEETVDNINASLKSLDTSMEGINKYITKADQFRTFISYRGEYLFEEDNAKSHIELTLRPREDKYYILGVVADPRGKKNVTDRTIDGTTSRIEEWDRNELLFNAEIAKRYKDVVIRGGLLESTGGVGIDYFAFNDDLRLTFEAFDFDSERNPHLKFYAEYSIFNHIYLSAGYDDFISDEGNESP